MINSIYYYFFIYLFIFFLPFRDKVHFYRFLNVRDTRFGLSEIFLRVYMIQSAHYSKLNQHSSSFIWAIGSCYGTSVRIKLCRWKINVRYRIEIATVADELWQPKYLQWLFIHTSDKSAQFELSRFLATIYRNVCRRL